MIACIVFASLPFVFADSILEGKQYWQYPKKRVVLDKASTLPLRGMPRTAVNYC